MTKKYEAALFIDGKLVPAQSGKTFEIRNPANDEHMAEMPIAGQADIDAAVAAAAKAQPAWSATSASDRAAVVRKYADLMMANAEQLAELDSVCMGKPMKYALEEVEGASKLTYFFAGQIEQAYGRASINRPGHLNLLLRQPFGVVAAIVPWNFPIEIYCHEVPAACGAGNAIILKGVLLAKLALEAGFPPGIVNVVSGAADTGELLSTHMKIRKISFTGSLRAGRAIMHASARSNLKAVTLELGGKSPLLVFDDADLESAATLAAFSITFNTGQVCTASSRLYLQRGIATPFKKLLVSKFQELKLGNPASRETLIGPLADSSQADAVVRYLDKAKSEGAKVLVGGQRSDVGRNYVEPTIFADVPALGTVNVEEVFGPVLVVHEFDTEQEAIDLANETEYGLYASVFSSNIDTALRVARALDAGNVGVNTASPWDSYELPFGGYKMSGIGRSKGPDAVLAWTEEKSVYIRHKAALD